MAKDYGLIIEIIVAAMKADSSITNLLVARTIGGVSSKANSIYMEPLTAPILSPCLGLRYFGPWPAQSGMHENPMAFVRMTFDVRVTGLITQCPGIAAEVDEFFELLNLSTSLDTADWMIKDVDTSNGWTNGPLPKGVQIDGSGQNVEMMSKSFDVLAASV